MRAMMMIMMMAVMFLATAVIMDIAVMAVAVTPSLGYATAARWADDGTLLRKREEACETMSQ